MCIHEDTATPKFQAFAEKMKVHGFIQVTFGDGDKEYTLFAEPKKDFLAAAIVDLERWHPGAQISFQTCDRIRAAGGWQLFEEANEAARILRNTNRRTEEQFPSVDFGDMPFDEMLSEFRKYGYAQARKESDGAVSFEASLNELRENFNALEREARAFFADAKMRQLERDMVGALDELFTPIDAENEHEAIRQAIGLEFKNVRTEIAATIRREIESIRIPYASDYGELLRRDVTMAVRDAVRPLGAIIHENNAQVRKVARRVKRLGKFVKRTASK